MPSQPPESQLPCGWIISKLKILQDLTGKWKSNDSLWQPQSRWLAKYMSNWITTTILLVGILKVPQDPSSVIWISVKPFIHFDLGSSNLYSAQMFMYTIPSTWLCHSKYACILHPTVLNLSVKVSGLIFVWS